MCIYLALCVMCIVLSTQVALAAAQYNESPLLATAVQKGELPSVEDRLPENPLVVEPVQAIGRYGGTLRLGLLGPADLAVQYWPLFVEPLVRWDRTGGAVVPNLAEGWNVSDDSRKYTFSLRKGIKWSDGTPLTADDIMFWYESILLNPEIIVTVPTWLRSDKTPVKVSKIDTYTVEFEFALPNVLFLENIAFMSAQPGWNMIRPKHYLQQFHPDYVPKDKLQEMAKAAAFEEWYQLFQDKMDFFQNPDHPMLTAWQSTGPIAAKTVHSLERNPYYWKVDTEGKQLPYIDRVAANILENIEVLNMKVLSGELDFDFGHMSLSNYPLLKENEAAGGYRVLLWKKAMGAQLQFQFNINHEDPFKQELYSNRDFRIALSHAINRDEINEFCFLGLAEPRHATVLEECPYYTEDIGQLYTAYDPAKANGMLDSIGLTARDQNGFRVGPDGKAISITLEYPALTEFGPWEDIISLVTGYWNAVGIKTASKAIDRSLYEVRTATTEMDAMLWAWGRGLHPLIDPVFVFPSQVGHYTGAPLYAQWYATKGASGEEPSADVLEVMKLYEEFTSTVDADKRFEIGKEIVRRAAEQIWGIGTVGAAPAVEVISERLRNIPESDLHEWVLLQFAHTNPEQYFFDQ